MHSSVDKSLTQDEYVEMMEIVDPDKLDMSLRRRFRIEKEYSLFSTERYVSKLMADNFSLSSFRSQISYNIFGLGT